MMSRPCPRRSCCKRRARFQQRPDDPARQAVQHEQAEQHHRRIAGDEHEHGHHQQDAPERHAAAQGEALAAEERRVRHHRDAGVHGHGECDPGHHAVMDGQLVVHGQPDETGHQRGGGGAGQALEVALVDHGDIGVEARQPQRGPAT